MCARFRWLWEAHAVQACPESRIGSQAVPLRRHRQMNDPRIAAFERTIQMLECRVEVAGFAVNERQLHGGERMRLTGSAL